MADWQELVHRRLAGLPLEDGEKEEVCSELAAHLEETYEACCKQGLPEKEAAYRSLEQVSDWQDLRRKIFAAKRRHPMKKRALQLWIPGLLTLAVSTTFLMTLQRVGFRPRIVSWGGLGTILLFVPWLLSLPLLGALAAYLSSRAGGSRRTALLASIFPAPAFAGALLFMFPIGLIRHPIVFPGQADFGAIATAILKEGMGWIVVPGVALLVGGLLMDFLFGLRSSSGVTSRRVISH